MREFDPQSYGPEFAQLLETNRCRPLGVGRPVDTIRRPLISLTVEEAFEHEEVSDLDAATCAISAVWLLYDFLDESHKISQAIETTSGSFWHGIMHRREGDFSNAKYWFRRVADHEIFPELFQLAAKIAEEDPQTDAVDSLIASGTWEPYEFIDLCQKVEKGLPNVRQECELIQQVEWELLFDYCYKSAVA